MYKTYDRLLYELATKNVVDKRALISMRPQNETVYRALSKAKEAGHVRETSVKVREGGRQHTHDYLVLTKMGLNYLSSRFKYIPWSCYIEQSEGRLVSFGAGMNSNDILRRFLRLSTTAVMADNIGARENLVFIQDIPDEEEENEDEEENPQDAENNGEENTVNIDEVKEKRKDESESKLTLATIIKSAVNTWKEYEDGVFTPEESNYKSEVRFVDALTIKRKIEEQKRVSGEQFDIKGGRYTGMFDTDVRSAMVYCPNETSILTWTTAFRMREQTAYDWVVSKWFNGPHVDSSANGIMLVPNEDVFERSYMSYIPERVRKQVRGRRKSLHAKTPLGEGFDRFWVVPVTWEGNKELRTLMTVDLKAEEDLLLSILIGSGDYRANREYISPSVFPLVDDFGSVFALGIHIDARMIQYIESMARLSYGDTSVGVLCRRWQAPYYRSVFQFAEVVVIDEERLSEFDAELEKLLQ